MNLRTIGHFCLDLLFPARCPYCGKVIGFADACPCGDRRETLRLPAEPLDLPGTNRQCEQLAEAHAVYYYEETVRDAVIRMKLHEQPELARPMGLEMASLAQSCALAARYDCLVPVPVSAHTLKTRGYNQSALLAEAIGAETGLPVVADGLVKQQETKQQMRLDGARRRTNVLGAYKAASTEALQGKRVLLVDDVITTGSTLEECAKTLVAAGAARAGALCYSAVRFAPGGRPAAM